MSGDQEDIGGAGPEQTRSPESQRLFVDVAEGGRGIGESAGAERAPSKFTAQHAMLLLVVVLGGGALYGMRTMGMGPGVAGATVSIDYKPGDTSRDAADRFARVMDDLERSGRPVQVPAGAITGSPFRFADRAVQAETGPSGPNAAEREAMLRAERERQEREQLKRDIDFAASRLRLQGVLGGRVPVARINGETVRVGDEVGEYFRAESIDGRSVVLGSKDGRRFLIAMGQDVQELPAGR